MEPQTLPPRNDNSQRNRTEHKEPGIGVTGRVTGMRLVQARKAKLEPSGWFKRTADRVSAVVLQLLAERDPTVKVALAQNLASCLEMKVAKIAARVSGGRVAGLKPAISQRPYVSATLHIYNHRPIYQSCGVHTVRQKPSSKYIKTKTLAVRLLEEEKAVGPYQFMLHKNVDDVGRTNKVQEVWHTYWYGGIDGGTCEKPSCNPHEC